jgi:hypothetical protein
MAKRYSKDLYDACLDFFLHKNQDYMTQDYQSRYMDLLMMVMNTYGTMNERHLAEYRDAEHRAEEIKSTPVYKAFSDAEER